MDSTETTERRDWDFDRDGKLVGLYVETRQVTIKNGPSAGQSKAMIDFHVGVEDELVTVWPPAVLRRMLCEELRRRRKPDFEAGEQIEITPRGKRTGANGPYWDFDDVVFEFAAPKPTAADLLGESDDPADERPLFESDAA
jgi:hypothetical protein